MRVARAVTLVVVGIMRMAVRTGGRRTHSTARFAVITAATGAILDLDGIVLHREANTLDNPMV